MMDVFLAGGLVPKIAQAGTVPRVVNYVRSAHDGCVSCGFVSTQHVPRFLPRVLNYVGSAHDRYVSCGRVLGMCRVVLFWRMMVVVLRRKLWYREQGWESMGPVAF